MNEIAKRKKELDNEYDELMEMDSDIVNTKSNMTISVVGKLLEKFNEYLIDMAEIAKKASENKYYDEKLSGTLVSAITSTIAEIKTAFSNIQPPQIKVTPNINVDLKPLEGAVNKMNEISQTLINLVNKFNNSSNNGQNDKLYNLIVTLVEKQKLFLEREFKQMDYAPQLLSIEKAINNRPTEFKSKVTNYNDQGRIDEITTKVIK